jgi:hypothetical protein
MVVRSATFQPPLCACVSVIKEGEAFDKLTLEGQSFLGAFDSSSLEPFFDTLRDTAYPLLTTMSLVRCTLRNMDIMVLVRCFSRLLLLECSSLFF